MKAISFKLATFTFAAMLLASCSDSNSNSDGGTDIGKSTTVVGSAVEAQYANDLAGRVINYKTIPTVSSTSSAARTRAINFARTSRAGGVKHPEGSIDLTTLTTNQLEAGKNYYVPAGKTVTEGFNLNNGATIYVEGNFTYNCWSKGTINVCEGGTLTAHDGSEPFGESAVSWWDGNIIFAENQNTCTIKNTFYVAKDLNIANKTLDLEGDGSQLYIGGNLTADDLKFSSNVSMACMGDVKITKKFYLTNTSSATINGSLNCADLEMNGGTKLTLGCALKTPGNVYITNGATIQLQYLKAANYYQDSQSKMILKDQSMVDVTDIYSNLNNGLGCTDLADKDGVAVIKCKRLVYNAPGKQGDWNKPKLTIDCSIFSTSGDNAHIIVEATDGVFSNGKMGEDVRNQNTTIVWGNDANVHFYTDEDAQNFSIKKSECNPNGHNDKDNSGTNDKPSLDLITTIDYDNHEHEISATGIMAHNGRMYMSYHTRDAKHGGCVEVFTPVTNNKVTLEQYLYDAAEDLDFNHLLAVKKKDSNERMVYLPGSSNKKGAMLAYIPILDNHLLATESKEITTVDENGEKKVIYQQPLNFVQMNPATEQYHKAGYDENCVVYNDETNHLIVMTTKGYLVYDADTYNELEKIEKPGKAKHVAIGNGKIVTLYLDREAASEEEAIPATVEVFEQKDEDLTNPLHSFTVNTIEPNNGKNVVAVKDNQIYVCRGAAGLYVYDMEGNEQWHYQMPNPINQKGGYKALANGCYVGDKYVYIAYGSYGLVVLDKTTHKVVARRAVVKSANYVVEHKGYIYVAYGKNRLQVFQLKNADPETSYEK